MKNKKLKKSIVTVILSVIMVFEMIAPTVMVALASSGYTYEGGAGTKVSDLDTSTKYSESLGDNASTEYAGRIWNDKSVYTDDVVFATFGGGSSTIGLNENKNGEDFLVAYSTLATSESISGQTQAPVDVVLIIDISGSMSNEDSNMDNNKSRIYNTVQAANNAIDELMKINPYTRVSVVAFSSNAQVLLPLDRYTKEVVVERVWVSTGYFSGYWQETEKEVPYLSVSRETASENNATLTVNAINSSNKTINDDISVTGGTNIQMGLYEGMKVLADVKDTKANINGETVQRVPSVIMISDGAPTYSSDSTEWWAPADNDNNGPGSAPYAGNGMKAILVGSYMKDAIDRNYGVANTSFATTVYTIGMGITDLDTNEKNLAYMTLNPGKYWNDTSVTNSMKTSIKDYWSSYTSNNNTGTLNINVGQYVNRNYYDKNYYLTHPTTGYDIDPVDGYDYVDDYYSADNASAVTSVFDEIVSNIAISTPQIPTEIKGSDPRTDGYITYTDPIGEFMEVKDVKAIIYAGETFTQKTSTGTNPKTYVFSGSVNSEVYGSQDIMDIIITVNEDSVGNQTLTIKMPASVIPLRVNSVELNEDGTVKTHTNNGAMPARVIYSVGIKSKYLNESDSGEIYVDTAEISKVSPDYIKNNLAEDGSINFYSNLYTGDKEVNGSTVGNTTVEFEPSHSNKFYYILEDMPIYKDAEFKNQVTVGEGIDNDKIYYYKDEYYHGTSIKVDAIERTGAQLNKTTIKEGTDGYLYRAADTPRLNRILKFEGTKIKNQTETAEDFYAPEFHHAEGSTSAYDGKFVVYLGNNGRISVIGGGNLQISKSVNAADGLTAPEKEFEFTIDFDGERVVQGEFIYHVTDANGKFVKSGTVSKDSPKITLKDGQTATVFSLPPETTYTVVETAVAGFVTESEGTSGKITANNTSVANFINTYNVKPVTFPQSGTLIGQKELKGREWSSKDSFSFYLIPYNNAPLPENYDANSGVTVNGPDSQDGQLATFDFGRVEFTKPGVYRYTITEKEPENNAYLPGVSYSRALYRLVVNVADNGDGTLKIESHDIQKLYDDNANQLFTYNNNNEIVMNNGEEAQDAIKFVNTYSAEAVTRVPVAIKDYTDNSGMKPLVSGMFEFKLEALGIVENNNVVANTASKAPMPEGSTNGAITTTNEGHNVTFPSVKFTQDVIPEGKTSVTFRYEMSEITPTEKVNGMTYDSHKHIVDVVVSIDPDSHILDVNAIYPHGESVAIFTNTYTPNPVKTDIEGKKTLIGRDMKPQESFEFSISGANAATNNAVRNGIITVPESTVTVNGGKDGVAKEFAFSNIEFKKAGTYEFAVTEIKGNSLSVEYDSNTINVTVVIDDANDDGNLEVKSVTYSNNKTFAEFTNTYTSKFNGEPISLEGTKNLTGKTLLDGEFYFNVAEYYNGELVKEGLVTHTKDETADANGVYSGSIAILKGVTFDKAGTYKYYITEQIPENKVGGTTYDQSKFLYTVEVIDNLDGDLVVNSKSLQILESGTYVNANGVVFNNAYNPDPVYAKLPLIKKIISGVREEGLQADQFSFTISKVSANPEDGMELPQVKTVTNKANGDVIFDDIKFTSAGEYKVAVREVIPEDGDKLAGITYSQRVIVATFVVTDDRNGNLTANLTNFDGDTFINEYKAEPADVVIDLKKNFTGRDNNKWLNTDKFDFEIVVLDPATQDAIANGAISFPLDNATDDIATKSIESDTPNKTVSGRITVNLPGTYKFIVREVTGSIPGVNYDSSPREIIIEAEDDSANAKITTKVSVNGNETNDLTLVFNNVYDPSSTEISGHDNLTVEKIFTGRANDTWLDTDEFKFELQAYGQYTIDAVANGDVELPASLELIISNANKAHPHFGNIKFHKEGTYQFKVTEINNAIPGVSYDQNDFRIVKVVVSNNDATGELEAKLADDSQPLTFTNTYSAEPTSIIGAEKLEVIKKMLGRNWFSDDKFTFTIAPYGGTTTNAVEVSKYVVMPALKEITITAPVGLSGDAKAYFGDITFKKAGKYYFVITENSGNIANVEYDSHNLYVIVDVVDNNEGQLVANVSYYNSNVFENKYTPDSVKAELKGEKKLEGNLELKAGDFEFTVAPVSNNTPTPDNLTVTNNANGVVDFGAVEYTEAGTYVYSIKETKGNIPGVTYDGKTVTATVTVSYDENTGKLSSSVAYTKEGEQGTKASFTFNNSYKAEASKPVSLTAKKKVTASEGNNYTLKGGEFTFSIVGSQGAPMPANTTVKNDADGNVNFGNVKFTEDGTYSYTITEVQGSLGGFTYDGEVYTVTVTVTDNFAKAKLETSVKITDSNKNETTVLFDNKYNPKETSALIFGIKELDSEHKQIEADEFEFAIKAVTQNAPMPADTTVKNTATGAFQFGAITYTKLGTYKYEITEKKLGKTGYTYDETVYTVTVKVTDEGNGQLVASVDGVGTAQNPTVKFVNKYTPKPVSITIGENGELSKELDGRDIRAEEFEFALLDGESKEIAADKNDADGKFEFTLTFNKADTYNYTIVEKNNGVAGVTYDEKVYGVEFKVVDNNGELKVESVTYTDNNQKADSVVFNNTYKADKTEIVISALKVLEGRDLADNEFKFVVKDKDGKVIATATNTKDGKIVFDAIELSQAGRYEFTVSEEEGILEYVTYDETEYLVKVEVVDDGNGKLKAEAAVISVSGKNTDEIVFTNTYEEPIPEEEPKDPEQPEKPVIPQTGDNTNINMWFALLFVSMITFLSTVLYVKRRRKCEQN